MNKAAQYVVLGAGVSDEESADALKKVKSSSRLVEEVKKITGKTTEVVLEQIQSTLARLNLRQEMEDTSASSAHRHYR
ncbi:hypothetical protein MRX96_017067 [Rhipicephalus microplus]